MKTDIHPDYHEIKVHDDRRHRLRDALDLGQGRRHAAPRHRSEVAPGLDRRHQRLLDTRRPGRALQQALRRPHARQEVSDGGQGGDPGPGDRSPPSARTRRERPRSLHRNVEQPARRSPYRRQALYPRRGLVAHPAWPRPVVDARLRLLGRGRQGHRRALSAMWASPTSIAISSHRSRACPKWAGCWIPGATGAAMRARPSPAGIAWAEAHLDAREFACIIDPDNAPSINVARKAGFSEVGPADYKGSPIIVFKRPVASRT